MNAQEYIASGLLEAYVLGTLSEAEADEVAQALQRYPDVAKEVEAIEETFLELGKSGAVAPPAHLQEQIWSEIAKNQSTNTRRLNGTATNTEPESRVIDFAPERTSGRFTLARAAVWAALIGSALLNLYLWNGKNTAEQSVVALNKKLDTAVAGQRLLALALSKYEHEVNMMANPDMHPVVMRTMQKNHPMVAVVYYNAEGTEAYVSLQKMPEAPKGMQYQLWAIADGKPVDLGTIRNDMVEHQGIEKLNKSVPTGQAFAISLEKEGGSPVPSMDKIFVMGKVPA